MGNEGSNLQNVIFWGGPNEEKASGSMLWDHDLVINFSVAGDKPKMLNNPEKVIPLIAGKNIDELVQTPVFDGATEYKTNGLRIELIQFPTCTRVKIWGQEYSYEQFVQKLNAAGAQQKKPNVEVNVPDRPKLMSDSQVNAIRFQYQDEKREKDTDRAKKKGLSLFLSNMAALVVFLGVLAFIAYQALVTRHIPLPLAPDTWVGIKGDIAGFYLSEVEGTDLERMGFRAGLVLLKFAEDVEALGVDSTCTFLVSEGVSIANRMVPDIVRDAGGKEIYNLGARTTEFVDVDGYEPANTNFFEVGSYQDRRHPEGDWAQYGELGKGNATRIVIRGGIGERENMHVLALARGYVKLGDIPAEGSDGTAFYNNLADNQSYVTALYSLVSRNTVKVFGQIDHTFTAKEGRNNEAKLLFFFRASYMRDR